MTSAAETGALMARFLAEVGPELESEVRALPPGARERAAQLLDPSAPLELRDEIGSGGWLRHDPGVARIFSALVQGVLERRDFTPSQQYALLGLLRRRADALQPRSASSPEEGLARCFARSPIPMMLLNLDGRVIFSNEALNRISRGNLGERFAQRSFLAASQSVNPELGGLLERIFRGEPVGVSRLPYRSVVSGEDIVLTLQSFPIFDGEGVLSSVCVLLADETERQALEQRLGHSRQVLAGVLDAIGDPVVTCDLAWQLQGWNRAAEEVLGLSEGARGRELEGMLQRAGSSLTSASLEEVLELGEELEAVLGRGGASPAVVYGVRVWEVTQGQGDVAPTYRVVVFRDLRAERERQHHLLAAKEHLERVNRELHHQHEAKVEFMNIVSHELRSPLVTIRGYVEMILRGNLGPVSGPQRQGLEVALRNAVALSDQIETLLDYSRVEQGRMSFALQPTRLGEQVRRAVESVRPVVTARGLGLEVEIAEGADVEVKADPEKVRRLVRLLLDNALKFTEEGSIGVRVAPRGAGRVEVVVWDTGVGIGPAAQERIFEPFYQVQPDRGGRGRGVGLGLAVAQALVAGHGASLRVESALGEGSRFVFELDRIM